MDGPKAKSNISNALYLCVVFRISRLFANNDYIVPNFSRFEKVDEASLLGQECVFADIGQYVPDYCFDAQQFFIADEA